MPVTLQVSPHQATSYSKRKSYHGFDLSTPLGILQSIDTNDVGRTTDTNISKASVIQSSITPEDIPLIDPVRNGFVSTCMSAYNQHHNLVLRPEDAWFAILAQFNFYVNAHAEHMRNTFVEHQGKKELEVIAMGTRNTVDWGWLAEMCSELIKKNIKDPSIHSWILPSFSTTTTNDTAIASILMMSTLKSYFSYKFSLCCGIPSVTLLGEKSDWESLLQRVSKFSTFNKNNENPELAKFEQLLTPVLNNFIETFEAPIDTQAAQRTKQFWSKICHRVGGGSGPTYLTGWLTAFCVFSDDGKWQGGGEELLTSRWSNGERLVLDQVMYPLIDTSDIPQSWAEVDVIVDDNGTRIAGKMVAGLIGTKATNPLSGGANKVAQPESTFVDIERGSILGDTIAPYPAWFMVDKGPDAKPDETEYPKAEPLFARVSRPIFQQNR